MQAGGELCDDQRCQVYLGAQAEYGAMNQAVDATRGQVLTAGGAFAATVYSSNAGGYEASREEGFGTADSGYPYLRPAPYRTADPLPWEIKVSVSDVADRLAYSGQLSTVTVTRRGPSHRALAVTLAGTAGAVTVTGLSFASALGLRSTLVTLKTEVDPTAPPPPPPRGSSIQVLPDQASGLAPVMTASTATSNAGNAAKAARDGSGPIAAVPIGAALGPLRRAPGRRVVSPGVVVVALAAAAALMMALALAGRWRWPTLLPWPGARPPTDGSS
jgi:SpoIID/LytB domain protein